MKTRTETRANRCILMHQYISEKQATKSTENIDNAKYTINHHA